ncbi:MAG: DsbA family protein [Oligoflexus sp.]
MNVGLLVTLLVGGLGLGGTLGYFFGQDQGRKNAITNLQITQNQEGEEKLFLIKDKVYTTSDLPSELQMRIHNAERETFGQKEGLLKEYALRLALAERKGGEYDPNNLPELEVLMTPPDVSEAEMKKFYEENKDRLPPNTEYDQIKDRLKQFLVNQKGAEVFHKEWDSFVHSGDVKLLVAGPVAPMVTIPIEKFPTMGAENASHTLVEVSDYLCPHCQTVHPQVKEALKELDGQVRLVQINFALRPDNLSGSLAEGAFCAQKQGDESFWKYHDLAFSGEWGSMTDAPSQDKPKEIAKKAGLDEASFASCLESQEPKEFIAETREIVNSMGVSGTPTFFLNNRRMNLGHGDNLAKTLKNSISSSRTGS